MGLKDSIQQVLARLVGADDQQTTVVSASDETNLAALEVKLGYTFRDRSLLVNALLHRSYIYAEGQDRESSNERLEFLGDAVLGLVANEELYHRYPDRSEGDLTKMKSLLVCGARLAEVAHVIELGRHICMSRSEASTGGRQRASILADATEAIIGAVYLDGGLDSARAVIARVVLTDCEMVVARRSRLNYKSRLQELIQSRHKKPPRYQIVQVSGPDHDRIFRVVVGLDGKTLGTGEGHNKKSAEQQAARMALSALLEPDDDIISTNPEVSSHGDNE